MSSKSYMNRNGITYTQYLALRAKVLFFQDFKCGGCKEHITHKRGAKELHHFDGNPRHNQLWNLVVLCRYCHIEAEEWQTSEDRGFYKRKQKPTRKQQVESRIRKLNNFVK